MANLSKPISNVGWDWRFWHWKFGYCILPRGQYFCFGPYLRYLFVND